MAAISGYPCYTLVINYGQVLVDLLFYYIKEVRLLQEQNIM